MKTFIIAILLSLVVGWICAYIEIKLFVPVDKMFIYSYKDAYKVQYPEIFR